LTGGSAPRIFMLMEHEAAGKAQFGK